MMIKSLQFYSELISFNEHRRAGNDPNFQYLSNSAAACAGEAETAVLRLQGFIDAINFLTANDLLTANGLRQVIAQKEEIIRSLEQYEPHLKEDRDAALAAMQNTSDPIVGEIEYVQDRASDLMTLLNSAKEIEIRITRK